MARKAWLQEQEAAGHTASTVRKPGEMEAGSQPTLLPYSVQEPMHGMVLPIVRVGFPISVNLIWKFPHRCIEAYLLWSQILSTWQSVWSITILPLTWKFRQMIPLAFRTPVLCVQLVNFQDGKAKSAHVTHWMITHLGMRHDTSKCQNMLSMLIHSTCTYMYGYMCTHMITHNWNQCLSIMSSSTLVKQSYICSLLHNLLVVSHSSGFMVLSSGLKAKHYNH